MNWKCKVKSKIRNVMWYLISRRTPNRQKLLLARPWDWHLLELYDFVGPSNPADNVQSIMKDFRTPPSPSLEDNMPPVDFEPGLRALRLIVCLGRPFRAFLLAAAQQWGKEYNRIAADHDVKDIASVRDLMDVKTRVIS